MAGIVPHTRSITARRSTDVPIMRGAPPPPLLPPPPYRTRDSGRGGGEVVAAARAEARAQPPTGATAVPAREPRGRRGAGQGGDRPPWDDDAAGHLICAADERQREANRLESEPATRERPGRREEWRGAL